MKVAFVVPGFSRDPDDWAIPALQSLACRLAQQHALHVFSLRYPPAGRYTFDGLVHHATGGGNEAGPCTLAVLARTVRALLAEHRRAPFDLLHAFWVDEPAFAAVLAGALTRRPVLASVGGGELIHLPDIGYGTWRSPWRRQMIRLALRRASLVTAGSASTRRLCIERGVSSAKVVVAPLGVDVEQFRPAGEPAPYPPVLVQAASLTPVKNQSLLLAVAARVRAACPELRLLVAGSGPLANDLRAEARRLGLDGAIVWQTGVGHPAMPAVYRQGHLYLQTSRHESQGMAVLEAMACGLPVLGTPAGLLPEVAALPATDDAERLARQVLGLLSNPALLAEQGQAARRLVESRYSLDAAAQRFTQLYETVTHGG